MYVAYWESGGSTDDPHGRTFMVIGMDRDRVLAAAQRHAKTFTGLDSILVSIESNIDVREITDLTIVEATSYYGVELDFINGTETPDNADEAVPGR